MAITQAMCTSFKQELLQGIHNFTNGSGGGTTTTTGSGNTFKVALYTSSATMSASTTAYATTNEVSGTAYTAGGNTLTNVSPSVPSGTTAITDFVDSTWSSSTITARGALIYNSSTTGGAANRAVLVLDFVSDKSSSSGDFTITFPTADASSAIIRIA